jgi:hypothetical protein
VSIKVRRDKNALTVFNPRSGDKVRFALGRYTKARVPELVDIKITDYCPFACAFCYQDSTLAGSHARMEDLEFIARELGRRRVFEVALGGGEPTDHPYFISVLTAFKANGVVANFTTKSLGYVKRNWAVLEPRIGAFAYSAETVKDLDSADKMLVEVPRERVNIHYVMGLGTQVEFALFMQHAHRLGFRVTLLGYKTVGRGGDVTPDDYSDWIDTVKVLVERGECPTFSIDTPLAAEFADKLPVDRRFFHTREGFVSAYIDAVKMGMSASSFDQEELVPFDQDWVRRYKGIVPV